MSSLVGLESVVVSRSGVQVRVRHGEIAAHVSSNPVRDVLLVHRVLVSFVLTGAGAIQVARLGVGLHAESELGQLATALLGLAGVAEVEVTSDMVNIGAGSGVLGVILLLSAARAIKTVSSHVFAEVVVVLGLVRPGADSDLGFLTERVAVNTLHDLERGDGVGWVRLVSSGAGDKIAVICNLSNFATKHRLLVLRLLAFGVVLARAGVHVAADLVISLSVDTVHAEV